MCSPLAERVPVWGERPFRQSPDRAEKVQPDERKPMKGLVKSWLRSVKLEKPQMFKAVAIVPIRSPGDGTYRYRCLGEALKSSDIAITEVSAAGSVPELLVTNRGKSSVLLIDGEELSGAFQNRVLNTSILLKEASETRIPVSCTEQGRWSPISKLFSESGNVMAYKTRSRKTRSVHSSLEANGTHRSDQSEVWHGISELQAKTGTHSPTSAMNDVFKAHEPELRKCDEIFTPVPNQIGLIAFIGGAPVGLDIVSLSGVYARLHPKLVRSYILEALAATDQSFDPGSVTLRAEKFLDEITLSDEREFASTGHGIDHRFKGKGLAGSALVHENEVIHAAFFRLEGPDSQEGSSSHRQRRLFRM